MSKRYMFVWDFMGSPVSANITLASIAWLIGSIGVRGVRIWDFNSELFPVELKPLINHTTHEVALMDQSTGVIVEQSEYPHAG